MTFEEFDKLVSERVAECLKVLDHKAKDYGSSKDNLHSVNEGAKALGIRPDEYALYLMTKHFMSIMQRVRSGKYEGWDEKIGDLINYCLILDAVVTYKKGDSSIAS